MPNATATALALVIGLAAAAPSVAQAPAAAPAPSQAIPPTKNPAAAPAGVYNIDLNHSSVIARVPHGGGASFSTMRFGVTKAVLTWDPANPANIKLEATVDTKPHVDPVVYRAGPDAPPMLNSAMFPTATFVSTAVKKTGAATADVEGNLTLVGVTKPVVIKMELVGAGRTAQGKPVVGFVGHMPVKRSDFWPQPFLPNAIGNDVTVILDGEFLGG